MSSYHAPVMPKEAIEFLQVRPDFWYIDCNLGGGGHTDLILKEGGKVIGIDLDSEAINEVARKYNLEVQKYPDGLGAISENLILYQANFSQIKEIVQRENKKISGVLFDLGVSSHQLEEGRRGFSFNTDAPLDMRMDQSSNQATAMDLVNGLHENELAELFWKLGEERFARSIAKKIVVEREKEKITTTNQLANIILSVRKRGDKDRTHPATRVFQALRIAVNDELNSLRSSLPYSLDVLQRGGRLVMLTFHSLEDRIVKNFMDNEEENKTVKIITQKPIIPTPQEVSKNPRSRSGKLRVAEKL